MAKHKKDILIIINWYKLIPLLIGFAIVIYLFIKFLENG